jgi:hypothetical protein
MTVKYLDCLAMVAYIVPAAISFYHQVLTAIIDKVEF